MKLFAKRTKKVTSSTGTKERTVFKSDPVCEDLLQKDPSTWNAKQRRMIKRYQDRKKEAVAEEPGDKELEKNEDAKQSEDEGEDTKSEEGTSSASDDSGSDESDSDGEDDHEQEDKDSPKVVTKSANPSDDDDNGPRSENSDGNSGSGEGNDDDEKQDEAERKGTAEEDEDESTGKSDLPAQSAEKDGPSKETVKPEVATSPMESPDTTDLDAILERLDSKNRRKLRRKLDRGEGSAEEIRKEAMSILEPAKTVRGDESGSKRTAEDLAAETNSKKGKKRRKVDWSTLPPEERMRREEQRRKQQEVAARRAAGETPSTGHRHPLNSERRRANRRKPKWEKPKEKPVGNEHDTSGFHMRRSQAAGFQ